MTNSKGSPPLSLELSIRVQMMKMMTLMMVMRMMMTMMMLTMMMMKTIFTYPSDKFKGLSPVVPGTLDQSAVVQEQGVVGSNLKSNI